MTNRDENNKITMGDADVEKEERTTQSSSTRRRKWLTCFFLLIIILAYLFVGALIFHALERPGAVRASENFDAALRRLASNNDCANESDVAELMNIVMTAIGEGGYNDGHPYACQLVKGTVNESYYSDNWGVAHSFVFATTVVTTIGFGYTAPRTGHGQLFCMFYAIIGIGITGSILLSVGEMLQALCFSTVGTHIQTFVSRCSKAGPVLANIIFVYLLMIIPTSLIYFFTQSDWSYIDSHYFSVVAMTTIGFGDLEDRFEGISTVELYLCRIVLFSYLFFCLGAVSTMLDTFTQAQRRGSVVISSRIGQYKKRILSQTSGGLISMTLITKLRGDSPGRT